MLNPSISAQPKPLRFKNYDDLKKHAEMDRKMLAQLKEHDLEKYNSYIIYLKYKIQLIKVL